MCGCALLRHVESREMFGLSVCVLLGSLCDQQEATSDEYRLPLATSVSLSVCVYTFFSCLC